MATSTRSRCRASRACPRWTTSTIYPPPPTVLPFTQLTDDLWVLNRPARLGPIDLGHRMTVVRLASGRLWVHSSVALDLNELCLNGTDDQQEQWCHQQSPEELGSQMGGRHCVEGQENVPWRRLGSRKSLESGLSALMKGWLEENGRDG